jgi:putative ABC transport system permease protein
LRPVAIGLGAGAGAALVAGRVAAAMFFGVSPHDPLAFAGATAIVLAAALVAVLVPTRRAAAVDPASVLRRS